jgi:hypothetical protein
MSAPIIDANTAALCKYLATKSLTVFISAPNGEFREATMGLNRSWESTDASKRCYDREFTVTVDLEFTVTDGAHTHVYNIYSFLLSYYKTLKEQGKMDSHYPQPKPLSEFLKLIRVRNLPIEPSLYNILTQWTIEAIETMGAPVAVASNSSASNSSAPPNVVEVNTSSTSSARPYTYVLDYDRLDSAESVAASRKFMHGLDVYIQMSKSQPQLGGVTVRQTPEGIRFSVNSHSGTATQMVEHYRRTLCNAPFNFHPLYYIFVERGHNANLSLAQILNMEFSPEQTGKLDGIGTNFLAYWPSIPSAATATATAAVTTTAAEVVVVPPSLEEATKQMEAKLNALRKEQGDLLRLELLVNAVKTHQARIAELRLSLKEYL